MEVNRCKRAGAEQANSGARKDFQDSLSNLQFSTERGEDKWLTKG